MFSSSLKARQQIIYGVPVEENDAQISSTVTAECIYPTTTAEATATYSLSADYCYYDEEAVSYSSDSDFYDVIEILAHNSDNEEEKYETHAYPVNAITASPVAMPVSVNVYGLGPITYVVPECQLYHPMSALSALSPSYLAKEIEAQAMPILYLKEDEHEKGEVIATEIISEHSTSEEFSKLYGDKILEHKTRRLEAAQRLRDKRSNKNKNNNNKKKNNNNIHNNAITSTASSTSELSEKKQWLESTAVQSSVAMKSSASETAVSSARKKATAKRERENGGKFKKAKTKWVSVTDLFGESKS